MRNLFCVFLFIVPLSAHAVFLDCVFFDGVEDQGTTNSAALAALRVHNCARKTVVPAAGSPIPSLVWSTTVASAAQSWANGCMYEHGGANGYGQNLFVNAGGATPTFATAANYWVSEQSAYDYASNTCAGQMCGHYTQMVWSTTTQIGCGQAYCTTNSPFGLAFPNWNFIVCDYNPPGNYSGNKPY